MRILVDELRPFSVELEERRTIPCTSYPFASSNGPSLVSWPDAASGMSLERASVACALRVRRVDASSPRIRPQRFGWSSAASAKARDGAGDDPGGGAGPARGAVADGSGGARSVRRICWLGSCWRVRRRVCGPGGRPGRDAPGAGAGVVRSSVVEDGARRRGRRLREGTAGAGGGPGKRPAETPTPRPGPTALPGQGG